MHDGGRQGSTLPLPRSRRMNMMSETRRRLVAEAEKACDWRSDEQRLADAVTRHLLNIGLCESLGAEHSGNPAAWTVAVRAYDDSQADLFRLVEDHCLIDPRKLGKALIHALP